MEFWQELKYRTVSWIAAAILRLWSGTCRIEHLRPGLVKEYVEGKLPAVLVGWHRGAIFYIIILARLVPAAIMISRSKDGEYLARTAERLGLIPVRGSSSRGGRQALDEMAHYLKTRQGLYAGTVADGPRGPRNVAKKGMVVLAQRAGVPLIPCAWSCSRAWTLRKAWDKTILPKPFSTIFVDLGDPIQVPSDLTASQVEAFTQKLTDDLNMLTDKLDRKTGYRE